MKLTIRNPFRRTVKHDEAPIPEDRRPLEALTVRDIWAAPAQFNRATRRRAGLWGRIWKWDTNVPEMYREYIPRYVRRHFDSGKFLFPKTRRQRRHRARIIAISNRTGVGR